MREDFNERLLRERKEAKVSGQESKHQAEPENNGIQLSELAPRTNYGGTTASDAKASLQMAANSDNFFTWFDHNNPVYQGKKDLAG